MSAIEKVVQAQATTTKQLRRVKDEITPAVALTAFARADDRQRALDSEYQAHSKPLDVVELLGVIVKLAHAPTMPS